MKNKGIIITLIIILSILVFGMILFLVEILNESKPIPMKINHAYEMIKKNVINGKKNANTEGSGDMEKNPPNLEKNENNIMESGRP
ncbi:MAG: hypothetical protein J6V74_08440, partial [Bacteroidales bacterium]|nr:hypothetical protein [Bacteroidales bacterium]